MIEAKYKTWFGSLVAVYQVALDWTLNLAPLYLHFGPRIRRN